MSALALALALAGCGTASDLFSGEARLIPRVGNPFEFSDYTTFAAKNASATNPVAPEDLISAAGFCTASTTQPPVAAAAVPPPAETAPLPAAPRAPGDGPMVLTPGAAPPPAGPARAVATADPSVAVAPSQTEVAPIPGGVGLAMTECQVVRRVGRPDKFEVGADSRGERKVVLTYIHGDRPGIYVFVAGRLKEIIRAPEPPPPPKRKRKRRSRRRA